MIVPTHRQDPLVHESDGLRAHDVGNRTDGGFHIWVVVNATCRAKPARRSVGQIEPNSDAEMRLQRRSLL
jgi:hypothetical protein